jgi:hypothetical protein
MGQLVGVGKALRAMQIEKSVFILTLTQAQEIRYNRIKETQLNRRNVKTVNNMPNYD